MLQKDLDSLYAWSLKWKLHFNANVCKVLHYNNKNLNSSNNLDNVHINASQLEKDLGVNFDLKLIFLKHVGIITAKANSRLAIIKRTREGVIIITSSRIAVVVILGRMLSPRVL